MPIYEYECCMCGERFEAFRGIKDDDAEVECPVCGEKKPRRVISRTFGKSCSEGSDSQFLT